MWLVLWGGLRYHKPEGPVFRRRGGVVVEAGVG